VIWLSEVEFIFLGTGGGRFVTISQIRHTGGIRFVSPIDLQLDPGPGAIVYSSQAKLNPSRVKAILISHCHPDHYCDGEVFVEAMTSGMTEKRGVLVAPRSVISGNEVCGPCISRYHRSMPEMVYEVKPGDEVKLSSVVVRAVEARHADPDTVGFRFKLPSGDIGYTSDTEYFQGMAEHYNGVRLLILCVLRPREAPWRGHMCTDDAVKILGEVRAELAVITDFGMKMVQANPALQAKYIMEKTGVATIAAEDNMRIRMGKKIAVSRGGKEVSLEHFF